MSYLIQRDYAKLIQSENLSQVIGSDSGILASAQLTAIEEAKSYLVQKYDTSQEFKDTNEWDKTLVYNATDRVYLDADPFNVASTYAANDYVLYLGSVYKSIAGSAPGAWNASLWTLAGVQYQIFYAAYPQPLFLYSAQYAVGDKVFWKNKVYTCRIQTSGYSQGTFIQFVDYDNVPYANVAPDNVNNGAQYWGSGTAYTVPANTDILDTDFWTAGDNRSQQLVTSVLDITLYHVHSRISPRNIPDLRVKRYDDAVRWLKNAAKGEITAALPVLQPPQGGRIRYGGPIKNSNSY